jgi:hypothetical protein
MNRRLGIGREGGVARRSAQQVQRHFDRFIVGFVRRHVGLRAGSSGAGALYPVFEAPAVSMSV